MVRVVFAEDNYLVREGTAALLQTSEEVELIGTESTVLVDLEGHTVRCYDHKARKWESWSFEPAYDRMYVDEIEHFFACVEGGRPPLVDLRAGYRVQRIIDACARSSASGRFIDLE